MGNDPVNRFDPDGGWDGGGDPPPEMHFLDEIVLSAGNWWNAAPSPYWQNVGALAYAGFTGDIMIPKTRGEVVLSYATYVAKVMVESRSGRYGSPYKLSKSTKKTVTQKLQDHVTTAAKEVDALGDAAFTKKQLDAIKRNPNLRPMFRGNRIDVKARRAIERNPDLQHLKSNYTKGADFVNPETAEWWDMTTPGQWLDHVARYGTGGTLLTTHH